MRRFNFHTFSEVGGVVSNMLWEIDHTRGVGGVLIYMSWGTIHPFFSIYQRLLGISFAKVGLRSPASETFTRIFSSHENGNTRTISGENQKLLPYSNISAFRTVDWSQALEVARPLIRVFAGELYRLRVKLVTLLCPKPSTRAKIAALSTGQYSSPIIS